MYGTETGRIIAIKHLPKIEIKNTLIYRKSKSKTLSYPNSSDSYNHSNRPHYFKDLKDIPL